MSGRKGTSTFILQRATAVLMLPFAIWFLYSIATNAGGDYDAARAWLAQPMTKAMLGGLVTVGAFHMRIGMGEVIDDYIHGGLRGVLSMLNLLTAVAVVAATWWSLLNL